MKTLQIMKNTEAAGNYGSMFGQDVEPSGTYVLERDENAILLDGWISGVANLENPLYIDIDYDTQISYKKDLSDKYKAKGKRLTNKLMKEGYDAIITRYPKGFTGDTHRELRDFGSPYNGYQKTKGGVEYWCLPYYYVEQLDVQREVDGEVVAETLTLEEFNNFGWDVESID